LKNEIVRNYVIEHLKQDWSPEQIAGTIKLELNQKISHETIYQYVYAQIHRDGYGLLRSGHEDLRLYLKRRHKRRGQRGNRSVQRVLRPKGPSIEDRPLIVEQRLRVGDWESDSIASKDNAPGLNSLVERKTGLVLLTKVQDKTAAATTRVIARRLSDMPRHTITFDNGSENQNWQELECLIGSECFFAHPYHSWERGTNENTNGLVRWYFPKGTDFRTIPEEAIKAVEYTLNTRPRKRLNWKTPLEVFNQGVALQG
jgi:IS30 family transposase